MRLVLLALSFALIACTKPAPVAPSSPPVNLACAQARTVDKSAACIPVQTGVANQPDIAWADVGHGVLLRCYAGEGLGAECRAFADMRPRAPEQPKPESPPAGPAATAPTPPAAPSPSHDPPDKGEAKKK